MSESPFRERRVPAAEARRIVARAAEQAQRSHVDDDAPTVTEAELARKLAELGLPDDAIRRALADVRDDDSDSPPTPDADGWLRVLHTTELAGEITPERHERLAEAMSTAMGSRGQIEVVGQRLTWTPGGMLHQPALTVRSHDGVTELRVEEVVANRGQVIVGSVTAALFVALFTTAPGIGLAALLGLQPHTLGFVALVVAFVAVWAGAAVFATRRLFRRRYRTRTRALDDALRSVEGACRGLVTTPARTRIADTAVAEPAETNADAEAVVAASDEASSVVAKPR